MLPNTRKTMILEESDEKCNSVSEPTPMTNEEIKSFTCDLRKVSSSSQTKSVLDNLEIDRKNQKFTKRIEFVLEKLDTLTLNEDTEKLHNMFKFVMQSANDLLGPVDSEETNKLCISLLKRFVKNDEVLCNQIFQIVKPTIKKLTAYRKYKHTMLRQLTVFFSWTFQKVI